METTKSVVEFADVLAKIEESSLQSDDRPGHWFAVRVAPDGSVYISEEVSECYSESEYYGREPHTVTVWSKKSSERSGPSDGIRYWEPCEELEAEFWTDGNDSHVTERDEKHTQPHKLGGFVEFEIHETEENNIREKLERCPWLEVV